MKAIMKISVRFLMVSTLLAVAVATARADEISDWSDNLFQAARTAGSSPLLTNRFAAIVQAAVFDAVNGIDRRYTPVHVEPNAPPGASRRAAAVQAAYASLVKIYPAQQAALDSKLAASLAAIAADSTMEDSVSIQRGIQWGQAVADAIWAWRSADGITPPPPPFIGGTAPGQWRPTPPAFLPGAGPQFATMTPWVIAYPSQFRPGGPPALTSDRYVQDFNETESMGSINSASRTADETLYAKFWDGSSPAYFWDQAAVSLAQERHLNFSEESRLLALVNLAIADANIGCWDAKYFYVFWRPITAVRLASTDGNPATIEDSTWTPLRVTPAFPEYPSGHACASSAAARVLSTYFGESTPFTLVSNNPEVAGVTRFFPNFSAAVAEVDNARIFAGIHFRSACDDGGALGLGVADFVLDHALLPVNGNKEGQLAR
jgi:hypothetical protein